MKTFGEIYKLRNLIKEPSYFKNPENPTCIDLILTKSRLVSKYLSHRDRAIWLSQGDSSCDEKMISILLIKSDMFDLTIIIAFH